MVENISSEKAWQYELVRDGEERILRIDADKYHKVPSLEDDPIVMNNTINMLIKEKEATKIIYIQKREYEYDLNQTLLLVEIAQVFGVTKQRVHQIWLDASRGQRILPDREVTNYRKCKRCPKMYRSW